MKQKHKIKLSKFNVFFEEADKYYVSNTLSHSLIELQLEQYTDLENKCLENFSQDELECLYQEGIIVDSDLDEIGILRYAYDLAKHSQEYMEFVIAPTLNCNFACPYCFETKKTHIMDEKVQKKVIEFYEKQVLNTNYKKVKLAWYGGEPLLCFDVIKKVTERIIEINEKYNVDAEIVMTTNGYLINEETVKDLEKLKFKYIQITIDGPREIHNARRMLTTGKGTFDKIINNIKLFRESSVEISVRINIDKENFKEYKKITDYLDSLNMSNVRYYPVLVEFTPNQDSCRKCTCMTAKEFGDFANNEAKGYYFKQGGASLQNVTYNCGAEHFHSYIIDDQGFVYKCWNLVGYLDEALFNLDDINDMNPIVVSKYLARDPFSEQECSECAYLPICGGGCLYDYLHNKTHTCIPERYLYKQLVLKEYEDGGENNESD